MFWIWSWNRLTNHYFHPWVRKLIFQLFHKLMPSFICRFFRTFSPIWLRVDSLHKLSFENIPFAEAVSNGNPCVLSPGLEYCKSGKPKRDISKPKRESSQHSNASFSNTLVSVSSFSVYWEKIALLKADLISETCFSTLASNSWEHETSKTCYWYRVIASLKLPFLWKIRLKDLK